jgi:heterodisulfide reductase subunit B
VGGEAVEKYDQKVTCCGAAVLRAGKEPGADQEDPRVGYDHGAEMIVTPCPVCQMNVEVYQGQINKKYGTKFNIPVTYYSQLMAVDYGPAPRRRVLTATSCAQASSKSSRRSRRKSS